MLRSSLCDYSNVHILVKETITVESTAAADIDTNNTDKTIAFKNCALFIKWINRINNAHVDDAIIVM